MFEPLSWRKALLIQFVILFALTQCCRAHTTGLSTSDLKFGTNGLNAEVVIAAADLMLVLAHLETASPSDANQDGTLTQEEFVAGLGRLRKFAAESLVVEFDGQPVRPSPVRFALDDTDNFHMAMRFQGSRPARLRVRAVLFAHLPPDHIHFVSVHDADGKGLGNKMLNPKDDFLELNAPSGTASAESHVSTFTDFLKLGVEHIWTGYDHLMFLLALLLVCSNFKSAIEVITFFTVAHSITLVFATLNLVWVSSRVVEPAIAASIVYVGVENIVRSEGPKGRWLITFLFGLIHGFGFATVLRDMGVASSTTGVAMPLIGFNLGVEAGQIVVAGILLPIIWKLRQWQPSVRWGVPGVSVVVSAAGTYWLIQRLFFG